MGLRVTVLIPELAWEFRVHLREDRPLDSLVRVAYTGANLPLLDAHLRARLTLLATHERLEHSRRTVV